MTIYLAIPITAILITFLIVKSAKRSRDSWPITEKHRNLFGKLLNQ